MKDQKLRILVTVIMSMLSVMLMGKEISFQFQIPQSTDTNKIVRVVYPPLTEREGKGLKIPVPPRGHPRLFFRQRDIPALRAKVNHPLMKECWDRIMNSASSETDGRLKHGPESENLDHSVRDAIETRALLYAFFDDAKTGLVQEPFVGGVPEMIDDLGREIPNARQGFRLLFSSQPFPGFQRRLEWVREEMNGNWYKVDQPAMEGWLCPALFNYFDKTPARLFVKAEALVS